MQHLILKIKPEQLSEIIHLVDQEQKLDAINYIADQTPLNEIQALRVIDAITHEREHVLRIQHEQIHAIPEGLETFESSTVAIETSREATGQINHPEARDSITDVIEEVHTGSPKNMILIASIGIILLALFFWILM